jgi:hypothetical protein
MIKFETGARNQFSFSFSWSYIVCSTGASIIYPFVTISSVGQRQGLLVPEKYRAASRMGFVISGCATILAAATYSRILHEIVDSKSDK